MLKIEIESIEYRYFLQYGKQLEKNYQTYHRLEETTPEIEYLRADIEQLLAKKILKTLPAKIKHKRNGKYVIAVRYYPDFNKLIQYGYKLSAYLQEQDYTSERQRINEEAMSY